MIRTYACPDDCGLNCRVQYDGYVLDGAPITCPLMDRGDMYGWVPVEFQAGRHEIVVQVEEGGGVPVPQFVILSNALATMPPGRVRVIIEELDAGIEPAGGERR
jgi:hypothetical protein